jgi:hypothetical protein
VERQATRVAFRFLSDSNAKVIVMEHRDRLVLWGWIIWWRRWAAEWRSVRIRHLTVGWACVIVALTPMRVLLHGVVIRGNG